MNKFVIFTFVLVLAISLGILPACQTESKITRLTLLYTNDTHSNLDDIGRRATLVKQIRDEAGKDSVMLVDSGDVFTGSLYFIIAQGQADLWFMQYLGYEAMGLGNHEFDKGPQLLADFAARAGFPILSANVDFSQEKALAGKIKPWVILKKGSEKFGLIGLTTEETAEESNPGGNIKFGNSVQAARQAVADLKKQEINKILVLSQIGWDKDLELARQVQDIDVIIGGHTQIIPQEYPTVVNSPGTPTLVVQAGSQGKYLGRLNLAFDRDGILKNWGNSRIITLDAGIEADPACTAKLAEYRKPINELLSTTLGKTLVELDGDKNRVRSIETNLGDLVADSALKKAVSTGATLAIINGGAIRSSIPAGDISLGQVLEVLPYGSSMVVLTLSGEQIFNALENGVSQVEQASGRFPQVAGMHFVWNPQASSGSRIVAVDIKSGENYQPLDRSKVYKLVTFDFLAGGGDGYTALTGAANRANLKVLDYEILQDYIKTETPLNPAVEGRIKQAKN